MNAHPERVLAVLYEMALTIGSADAFEPLVTSVLQRLLFHTGFPAGVAVLRDGADAPLRIRRVIGSHRLRERQGETVPAEADFPGRQPRLLDQLDTLRWLLHEESTYRHALVLPLPRYGALVLLDNEAPADDLPLTGMFRPILANLDRALENCLLREASTRALEDANAAVSSALDLEKERALVTLRSIADGVITTDRNGRVDFMNPVAESITGWSATEAHGRPLAEVYDVAGQRGEPPTAFDPAEARLKARRTLLMTRAGVRRVIQDSTAPIKNRDGEIGGAVLVFNDVTPQRELERRLEWQANHDALTGLYNRSFFERHLQRAINDAHRLGQHHVLLYLDLDQFKIINDTCGHAAGDELLRQLGARLNKLVAKRGILARLGGDEFGLLVERGNLDAGLDLAEQVCQSIGAFRLAWEERSFSIGVSIGVVAIDAVSSSQAEVLSAADMSCYAAKEIGGHRIRVYRPNDAEMTLRLKQMNQAARLTQALEQNRFVLYRQRIQPIGDAAQTGGHFEVLLRMVDAQGRLVAPGAIIPAAERYGLMPQVDRWVIRNLLRTLSAHRRKHSDAAPERHSINLSGTSLGDERLAEFVREQFREWAIPPAWIGFEITETAAIANLDRSREFIAEMRALGCHFSLDDFGSGLSSFNYLREFDVDFIKIDGSFVRDVVDDPVSHEMVASIHRLTRLMGKRSIAEFVENEQILARLQALGVDFAQGYLVDRPRRPDWFPMPPAVSAKSPDPGLHNWPESGRYGA